MLDERDKDQRWYSNVDGNVNNRADIYAAKATEQVADKNSRESRQDNINHGWHCRLSNLVTLSTPYTTTEYGAGLSIIIDRYLFYVPVLW